MPAQHYYTAAELLDLPEDGKKYEVVHGELLVSPSPRPRHQFVLNRLAHQVTGYLERFPIGLGASGGDLSWSEDTLVIPDFLVVGLAESRTLTWQEVKHPLLVVEVLSPSSGRADRFTKRRLYQEVGIPVYWLVDADAATVEVWTPDTRFPMVEQEAIQWHPEGAGEPLVVDLKELFREL